MPHKKTDTNRKIITVSEFNEIIERFPLNTQYHIILMICFYTGLRIAECTGLTWDRIDLDKKTLSVDRILVKHENKRWYLATPKTESSYRTILIGENLVEALKKQRKWQLENRMKYGDYYNNYYLSSDNNVYYMEIRYNHKTTDNNLEFICTQENGTVVNLDLSRYCS